MQQAVVELSPSPAFGVRAGLLLLPLGIINQTNAFPTYLTVDRPLTDRLIIPTIWRELGAGIFGDVGGALRFELDVVGGLNGTGFAAQAPLAGGRGNGRDIAINGAAVTGRLELYSASTGFVMGGSGYYGSASGGQPLLDGVRVGIVEGDVRFRGGGFDLRAEYAQVFIFNSYRVNDYLGLLGQDAIPKTGRGGYVQAGYDVLRLAGADIKQELLFFARLRKRQSAQRHVQLQLQPARDHRPGRARAQRPVARPVVRARRHRLPPAAGAGVQGGHTDRARRRGPAAGAADDPRRRARDAAPARPRAGAGRAGPDPGRPGPRLRVLTGASNAADYSTVTDFARLRGWSTSLPLASAIA